MSAVYIHPRILFLPFRPPVLEPDFDLGLCQVETERKIETFTHRKISGCLELVLQADELLVREGSSRSSRFASSFS